MPLHQRTDPEDPEEYILEVLRKKRERALKTAHESARLLEKTKQENLMSRYQVAEAENSRRNSYRKALVDNFQKLAHKYDDSPFRNDVVFMHNKCIERREKEMVVELQHSRIQKQLEAMKGYSKNDVMRLAPAEMLSRVTAEPISRLELERHRSRVDGKELKKELTYLSKMVDHCLVDTSRMFPVLQGNPRIQAMLQPPSTPKPLHPLAPHNASTFFIRNDSDFGRAKSKAEAGE